MTLVAGVDSSTQSCKVVIRDASTGALVRHGSAKHPDGTEVDPAHWERAFHEAVAAAGGIDDVAAWGSEDVDAGGVSDGAAACAVTASGASVVEAAVARRAPGALPRPASAAPSGLVPRLAVAPPSGASGPAATSTSR